MILWVNGYKLGMNQLIVKKPWGYEYPAFENDEVGIWILHIKNGESTSLHCHPNKETGLIVLQGVVAIDFMNHRIIKRIEEKTMLRRGLFHKSTAINGDAVMLEIESPNNKTDLVRLEDKYNRNSDYEKASEKESELDLSKSSKYNLSEFGYHKITNKKEVKWAKMFIFTKGGLRHGKDMIVKAGDVLDYDTFKRLLDRFDLIETEYITIC